MEIGEAGTHRSEERRVPLVGPWPHSAPSYQMTTTTATRASIHDPPQPPLTLRFLGTSRAVSELTALLPTRTSPPATKTIRPAYQNSTPTPYLRLVLRTPALSLSFHPSSISQHITPNSHFYFQPPAYITNTHTPPSVPIVSPSLAL